MNHSLFTAERLRVAAPMLFAVARREKSREMVRRRLATMAQEMEFDTFYDYGCFREGSIMRVRDCAQVFRSIITKRSEDLANAMGASRASVSTMTRMLMQMELIERIGIPGTRKRHYRIKAGGFAQLLQAKARMTSVIRQMSERGLAIMADEPPEMRQRLEDYREFYAFFEKEFPALIRKWEQRRKRS